jgi:ribonuclease III
MGDGRLGAVDMPLGGLKGGKRERSDEAPASSVRALGELVDGIPEEMRKKAFTHYTWVEDDRESYKRLAFIGDSVLGLFVAEELNARFPDSRPGLLTQIRSRAVSGVSCKEVGRTLGIPSQLEALKRPRLEKAVPTDVLLEAIRPVAEVTEALIGACYLTFGFERTRVAVLEAFEPRIQAGIEEPLDPKTLLRNLLSRRGDQAHYEVVSKLGSRFYPKFMVAAVVSSKRIGWGKGRSLKAAEQAAAEQALQHLSDDKAE